MLYLAGLKKKDYDSTIQRAIERMLDDCELRLAEAQAPPEYWHPDFGYVIKDRKLQLSPDEIIRWKMMMG